MENIELYNTNGKLYNTNGKLYNTYGKLYTIQMENYIQYKWKRSNIATFDMSYVHACIYIFENTQFYIQRGVQTICVSQFVCQVTCTSQTKITN
jgi:restriction endonuclease S subunit